MTTDAGGADVTVGRRSPAIVGLGGAAGADARGWPVAMDKLTSQQGLVGCGRYGASAGRLGGWGC